MKDIWFYHSTHITMIEPDLESLKKKEFDKQFRGNIWRDDKDAYTTISEELWDWIESKLNEEREKSYLQGLKEGTDLAEERNKMKNRTQTL